MIEKEVSHVKATARQRIGSGVCYQIRATSVQSPMRGGGEREGNHLSSNYGKISIKDI